MVTAGDAAVMPAGLTPMFAPFGPCALAVSIRRSGRRSLGKGCNREKHHGEKCQ
jgi:hypothetical protein